MADSFSVPTWFVYSSDEFRRMLALTVAEHVYLYRAVVCVHALSKFWVLVLYTDFSNLQCIYIQQTVEMNAIYALHASSRSV